MCGVLNVRGFWVSDYPDVVVKKNKVPFWMSLVDESSLPSNKESRISLMTIWLGNLLCKTLSAARLCDFRVVALV
ncbi:hypothetical protein L1987_60249 [Smallanthus sonchifolius]|uniref:Uncharacterized protein n=1 Tax=Smallanthus sonchifolius TaxID=185202 RepID=A0ACB9D850_9ASTR|nr:hypothetical protein L1987_60249 [Smallanthus sonchifolius]